MKTWDDWSDFNLSFNVAKLSHPSNDNIQELLGKVCIGAVGGHNSDSYSFMYFDINSWADMGPIIVANGICLTSPTESRKTKQWAASWNEDGSRWSNGDIVAGHANPLRAAAIVFLEMNGVRPWIKKTILNQL